jgi:hypothetical protein
MSSFFIYFCIEFYLLRIKIDIFSSFEGDDDDALDALLPFMSELGVDEARSQGFARSLCEKTGNAVKSAAVKQSEANADKNGRTTVALAAPVSLQSLSKQMEDAVNKSVKFASSFLLS